MFVKEQYGNIGSRWKQISIIGVLYLLLYAVYLEYIIFYTYIKATKLFSVHNLLEHVVMRWRCGNKFLYNTVHYLDCSYTIQPLVVNGEPVKDTIRNTNWQKLHRSR